MNNIKSTFEKKDNNNLELTITIPLDMVQKTQEEIIDEMVKNSELPGFRKGKAPKKLVEQNLSKEKIREEVLKKLLPLAYIDSIKQHDLKPIINPQIHVEKIEDPSTSSEQTDWIFKAITCELPEIDLKDYKDKLKQITAKSKIVIPGKEQKQVSIDELLKALLENIEVKTPQILIDQEIDRRLAQTLDEIKKLGLSLEQYLSSTGKTPEGLRTEYKKRAEDEIKLEFALQKIAEVEKITVEEKEINEAIQKAKDEDERKRLLDNKYLLSSILRQQKTLDFLKNL